MDGVTTYKGKRPAELPDDCQLDSTLLSSRPPSSALPSTHLQRAAKRQAASPSPSRKSPNTLRHHVIDLLPIVPTLATTSPSHYGRINAENETNLSLMASVPNEVNRYRQTMPSRNMTPEHDDSVSIRRQRDRKEQEKQPLSGRVAASQPGPTEKLNWRSNACPLVNLPFELIEYILTYLSANDLPSVAATCRKLHEQAVSDFSWLRCVQQNVPGVALTSPGPCKSFRELYVAHDPVWFLPKYKIWFCDRDMMGKLVIVRFDPRRGCIEGHQLLAVSNRNTYEYWSADNQVIIHGFEPQVQLHLDKPVLQFNIYDRQEAGTYPTRTGASRFAAEIPMALGDRIDPLFSNFLLTRSLDPEAADVKLALDYPYDNVWPPPTIPARHHVSGARSGQAVVDLSPTDRPRSRRDVSDQTFRIRQWMQMPGPPSPPSLRGGQTDRVAGMVQVISGLSDGDNNAMPLSGVLGIHIGEEIITYSTLDPVLYTPTAIKPWRGIWVGDYSGHGCEFLLINQPDDPDLTDAELGLVREADETDESWRKRRSDTHMYRGRLEAIKLTGDPNVPRGEYTFVADDLGPDGFVGIATDPPFTGARIVKSKGHIAATNFLQVWVSIAKHFGAYALYVDKYIESQLFLLGPNRLAQYWVGFGHISFFERVRVDDLIVP
ncbi:hypothetical protein QQS21_002885 [Conoideocrella luteorostrata]|uniref:F-box domain-containing protein n=1 Tax=Conoideocrella luteorostrata TaxID=1105319 RepID=A0AAJ0G0Z3_9HYPO|nr:hypothetical protein QQS21_002885 [Conoideocrella luteorostrata]